MSEKYTIRADSLSLAIKKAKVQFGRDVVVLGTRTVRTKEPGGLGVEPHFELTVAPGEPASRGTSSTRLEAPGRLAERGRAGGDYAAKLQEEIKRIERLIGSITEAESKLESLSHSYPLAKDLSSSGVSRSALRFLQSCFEEGVAASERHKREEALRHLKGHIRCTRAGSLGEISGVHLFLGSAGAGKSTLVIKLAAALVHQGRDVGLVLGLPYHSGDVKRIETAASVLVVDAAVARDSNEFERAIEMYQDKHTVLVDTPCLVSRRGSALSELLGTFKEREDVYKHYVCALTSDYQFIRDEIALYGNWRCDFMALSKADLVRKRGKIIDMALNREVTFSFVSYDDPESAGLLIATPEILLRLVLPLEEHGRGTLLPGGLDR